jgi:hypothetical protein
VENIHWAFVSSCPRRPKCPIGWLFTTPANRADIPRALTVIDLFLEVSWIELAFIAVLLKSVAGEVWQHRKQNRLKMMEAGS